MTVLVTGAGGQLGRELVRAGGDRVIGLTRARLDITDREAVRQAMEMHAPTVVLNAAAYTAVDRAESEPEAAFAVNRDGPAYLADACAEAGIPLLHVSTDYVFDGTKGAPYTEDDKANPLGIYGQSKWAGEEAVRARLDRHVVLRTSWVFSAHGHNFVKTVLRLSRERDALRIVADQHGTPTAAADLARAALQIAERLATDPDAPHGTFHFAGMPATTWHGLAEAVVEEARRHGSVRAERAEPIPTSAYPTPARRPADARLDTSCLTDVWGIAPPSWRDALREVVAACMEPAR
ncbi:MAG: dTDP-4-dehydrorhamnose reductase [Bacteroidota bacterium]